MDVNWRVLGPVSALGGQASMLALSLFDLSGECDVVPLGGGVCELGAGERGHKKTRQVLIRKTRAHECRRQFTA